VGTDRLGRSASFNFFLLPLLLLPLLGCGEGDFQVDLDLQLSEIIPTVAHASWAIDHDDLEQTWLRADAGSHEVIVPVDVDADGNATALIRGLKADRDYTLRVVELVDGIELRSQSETLETGAPPFLADLDREGGDAEGFMYTSIATDPSSAVILDEDGEYVWWHQPSEDWKHIFIPRVVPSLDGTGVIYEASTAWIGTHDDAETIRELLHVAWDGAVLRRITIERAHHDFVELPDGTVSIIRYHTLDVDGQQVEGDRIVEIHPDGTEVEVWTVWDHEEFDPEVEYGPEDMGWSHMNALDYDPDEDVYYLGSRHLHTIYKIDRATGDVLWRLGGDRSDFDTTLDPPFSCQHQFEVTGDHILVLDNSCPEVQVSRVTEMSLDTDAWTADEVWSYDPDPPIWSYGFGDVTRLPSDNTLITWSTAGRIDEVTPDGDVVWSLFEELGGGFGYTTWRRTLYE